MKTLAESLFGNNITTNVNITNVQDAEQLVVTELEDTLKIKCINAATVPKAEQIVWKTGKWVLVMYPINQRISSGNIYLQYNLDWPNHINPGEDVETIPLSIRFIIRISDWRENQVILKEIGAEVYKGFDYESATCILDTSILHHTRLKDVIFNTNTLGIVKFLGECFTKFKFDVENGEFNEVFQHLYSKHIYKGRTRRKYENLAAQELSKIFNIIVR